jgi:hypothetical protein
MIRKLLMILMMLTAYASAEQPRFRKLDWALLGTDAGFRALDVYSTHRMLAGGNHEKFLPDAIAHHTPVMASYSAGVVALNYLAMRKLERRHPKLARLVPVLDICNDAPWAVHNLFLRGR